VGHRIDAVHRWVLVVGAILTTSRPGSARPPSPDSSAAAQRIEATRLFRAKQYEAACPKFEAAVRLAPDAPALLADLALCEFRLGHDDVARELNRKVIALETGPARLGDREASRNRRHAYYNLAQLEKERVGGGSNGAVVCGPLAAELGCSKQFFACSISREDGWAARLLTTTGVRIALDASSAQVEDGDFGDPDFAALRRPFDPLPVKIAPGDNVTYLERYEEEGRGDVVYNGDFGCQLAYANACSGLVGLVCTGSKGTSAKSRTRVEEYLFEGAR
jgi:hypothetical protein